MISYSSSHTDKGGKQHSANFRGSSQRDLWLAPNTFSGFIRDSHYTMSMEEIGVENIETESQVNESPENESEFEGLVNDIRSMLETLDPPLTYNCCIYRVPSKIRQVNEEAYTPRVVSIGPFHNGDKKLQAMEKVKLRYLKSFLQRAPIGLEFYVSTLKSWEGWIRSSYEETIQHSSDNFVKMILIDACFILELFLKYHFGVEEEDFVLLKPWRTNDIRRDLILIENQLPFSVLEELFVIAAESQRNQNLPSLIELTLKYFIGINPQKVSPIFPVEHFTDLMRMFYLPPNGEQPRREGNLVEHLCSASELHEAGLKFKVSSKKCLLDLQYANGVLEIPRFEVYDRTETILRNMMAFEQCHYPNQTYITDYVFLLDFLINTTKDVDILVQNGIIMNWLGDTTALTTMVNNSCRNHTQSSINSNYRSLCDDLNAFYNDRWHRRKAILKRDYFRTPWKTASSIAAILLLLMTLIQTICSIIQTASL